MLLMGSARGWRLGLMPVVCTAVAPAPASAQTAQGTAIPAALLPTPGPLSRQAHQGTVGQANGTAAPGVPRYLGSSPPFLQPARLFTILTPDLIERTSQARVPASKRKHRNAQLTVIYACSFITLCKCLINRIYKLLTAAPILSWYH